MKKIFPLPLLYPLISRLAPTTAAHAVAIHADVIWFVDLDAEEVLAGFAAQKAVEDVASAVGAGDVAIIR